MIYRDLRVGAAWPPAEIALAGAPWGLAGRLAADADSEHLMPTI